MARRDRRASANWPAWRYGPNGESGIFQSEEDVPHGWMKTPEEIYEAPINPSYDRETLVAELQSRGLIIRGEWSIAYMKELVDGSSTPR